ncbi:ATP-binding protein, partial [Streptomyces sp. DSM 40712]|nr:ATP-binding protein [Streptomyces sp. DSM 40712]
MCPYADLAYGRYVWNTPPHTRHRGPMNTTAHQHAPTVRTFAQLLSSTRRGARLARLLAVGQLMSWEVSPGVTERT